MGPSYDVPNVLLTFGEQSDEKYHVTADYVIRGKLYFCYFGLKYIKRYKPSLSLNTTFY